MKNQVSRLTKFKSMMSGLQDSFSSLAYLCYYDHSEPLGLVFDMQLMYASSVAFVYWVYRLGLTARFQAALNKCYL